MSQLQPDPPARFSDRAGHAHPAPDGSAFAGLLEPVIVEAPVDLRFAGAITRVEADAAWLWARRDLNIPGLPPADAGPMSREALEPILPDLIARARQALAAADADADEMRRLCAQVGAAEIVERLPVVVDALANRQVFAKAVAFGRAANGMSDEAALAGPLQAIIAQKPAAAAFAMHAAIGEVANPTLLVTAALRLAAGASEGAVQRAGFTPLIDAILAHAQNQQRAVRQSGLFADMDMTCRAIERFHRLVRSVAGYVELQRASRWSLALSTLTKRFSDRLEPRLREVVPDIHVSLRGVREGAAGRLDHDRMLAALNGVYFLVTLRECKDSLALNALFEQAWRQSGSILENQIAHNLDLLRANPADAIADARLDLGIKMAEVRFNADYAETLRRARAGVLRR